MWLTARLRLLGSGLVAEAFLAMANAAEDELEAPKCVICLADLNDGEEVSALACCHSFHSYCLQTYASATAISLSAVRCPLCKSTNEEMSRIDLTSPEMELSPPWGGQGINVWQGHFDGLPPFMQLTAADVIAAAARDSPAPAEAA
jgi:hypothetical protein